MFFPQKTVLRTIILKRVNSRVDHSYQSKHIPTVHLRLKYTLFGKNREVKFSGRTLRPDAPQCLPERPLIGPRIDGTC